MDFSSLKEKAKNLSNKAKQATQDALKKGGEKLMDSKFFLKTPESLETFLEMTRNKIGTLSDGTKKEFTKRGIIIFCEPGTSFFDTLLLTLPILQTKTFSQDIPLRLADKNMQIPDKKLFGLEDSPLPQLVLYENTNVLKGILGEEKIFKIVKTPNLDIVKTVLEL